MILPLLLLSVALVAAGLASYGTDPAWITYSHGLDLICAARRLQWPLYVLCLGCCLALLLLVISGKRRVWWLIGLLPVLSLFVHHFATGPMRDFRVADAPTLVAVSDPHGVADDDFVVGVVLPPSSGAQGGGGGPVAYSYASLFRTPVVLQPVVEQRVLLVWNPYANLARAATVDRDLSPRELEVVSMPANASLVYNARYGQFINGITFKTTRNESPRGFGKPIETATMSFGRWRTLHPDTRVMPATETRNAPTVPLRPRYPIPASADDTETGSLDTQIVLLATTRPTALLPSDVSDRPTNLTAGTEPVVLLRDERTRLLRAYSRTLPTGEETRFAPPLPLPTPPISTPTSAPTPPPTNIAMVDLLTNEPWSINGRPQSPTTKYKSGRLLPIPIEEGGYYAVLKFWFPDLHIHHVTADDFSDLTPPEPPPRPVPVPRPKKKPAPKPRP